MPKPKPGKPGKKNAGDQPPATALERAECAADLLLAHNRKGAVVRELCARFDVGPRAAENYITDAKELLREAAAADRAEQIASAIDFYESIVRNPHAHLGHRIKARRHLDDLLGLSAQGPPPPPPPQYQHQADLVGNPTLLDLAQKIDALVAGGQADDAEGGA